MFRANCTSSSTPIILAATLALLVVASLSRSQEVLSGKSATPDENTLSVYGRLLNQMQADDDAPASQHQQQPQRRLNLQAVEKSLLDKQKAAIKKNFSKLLDDLIDSELKKVDKQQSAKIKSQKPTFGYKKKKWQQTDEDSDDRILILLKKPTNSILDVQPAQPQPAPGNPLVASENHARRIVDDSFGIRRDSVFSTNNHLGVKSVPKFGSDDEY